MIVRSLRRAAGKPALVFGMAAPLALGVLAFVGCSGSKGGGTLAVGPDAGSDASTPPDASTADSGIFVVNGDGSMGCDLTSDPKTNACVVSESYGLFVSAAATGSGSGTMADPYATISAALPHLAGAKTRVFVCNGDYAGPIAVTTSAQIYGGFSCAGGAWQWTGSVARVTAMGTDVPLTVEAPAGSVTIEDMAFVAPAVVGQRPDGSGTSSIAAIVGGGTVKMVRSVLVANNGAPGADGVTGLREVDGGVQPTNYLPLETDASFSQAPTGDAGTVFGFIVCNFTGDGGVSDRSTGGAGGDPTLVDAGVAGEAGSAVPPTVFVVGTTPARQDGLGGIPEGGTFDIVGHRGEDGVPRPGGAGVSPGAIVGGIWTPGAGGDGLPGQPGQGGGGGAGAVLLATPMVGGAGGSGGCGGAGAFGGAGGGASIALVVAKGAVTLVGCTLVAGNGGNGGNGGAGQDGQMGGRSLPDSLIDQRGGTGGNGAGGSGGAGGAGGLSAGIVYSAGNAPTYTPGDTVIAMGQAGAPGAGGAGGQGPGAPGLDGGAGYASTTAAVLEVESTP